LLKGWQGTVDVRGWDLALVETIHLVFHQSGQRGDDDGRGGGFLIGAQQERGELENERFFRAGGHHGQRMLSREQILDGFRLTGTKSSEAEAGAKVFLNRGHAYPLT
jgi:hypothetical protein